MICNLIKGLLETGEIVLTPEFLPEENIADEDISKCSLLFMDDIATDLNPFRQSLRVRQQCRLRVQVNNEHYLAASIGLPVTV